ncbi:hypothetical protein NAT51_08370 [Flavobacterium amniphilum]|uniref:hypothetical protein n=1 Tax=Flavobacterium amniphilum TaxID=1834035 RepID=UPI00202A5704|nr:hypothetical protein [Flavobacterium amniphilum]MCL9805534.1 hypothetical protein [Flavobacterium amniphilum]
MDNILIANNIEKDKVSIKFNFQDGRLSFPELYLSTSGDIELNPLVIKLTELLELHREIEITYEDPLSLLETDSKIKLVKETLDDIYKSFNIYIIKDEDEGF